MLWVGGPISNYEKLSILSFLHKGHEVNVYAYDENLHLPEGANLKSAQEILEISEVFPDGELQRPYALFSDLFRYKLLETIETTWVDCDIILIGEQLPPDDYLFGYQGEGIVNCAVLRAPKSSTLVQELVARSFNYHVGKWQWGDTGPTLLTELVSEFNLSGLAADSETLYPVPFQDAWRLFDPKSNQAVRSKLKGAATLHVWNEMISIIDPEFRNQWPPENSFMSDLFTEYGIERLSSQQMDPKKLNRKTRLIKAKMRSAYSMLRSPMRFFTKP